MSYLHRLYPGDFKPEDLVDALQDPIHFEPKGKLLSARPVKSVKVKGVEKVVDLIEVLETDDRIITELRKECEGLKKLVHELVTCLILDNEDVPKEQWGESFKDLIDRASAVISRTNED